jgi:Zn finger protein HypA/HybF involved in hydrogenase expression
MNERLLVKALLQQVDDVVRQRPQDPVISIRVRIGGHAQVDPDLLSNAFDDLVQGTARCSPRLYMERAPPDATCGQCGYKFGLDRSQVACEKCGSLRLSLEESEEV